MNEGRLSKSGLNSVRASCECVVSHAQSLQISCPFWDSRNQITAQNLPISTCWLSIYEKGQTFRQTECHCSLAGPLATATSSNKPSPSAHRSSLECELPSSKTAHVSMSGGARAGTDMCCQTLGTWEWKLVPRQQAQTLAPASVSQPAHKLAHCSLVPASFQGCRDGQLADRLLCRHEFQQPGVVLSVRPQWVVRTLELSGQLTKLNREGFQVP